MKNPGHDQKKAARMGYGSPSGNILDSPIDLPSPPVIALRILNLVKNDESSFRELARVISSDPALSAKLLCLANSPLYGFPRQIGNIGKALTVLGYKALKNIALSFVLITEMKKACGDGFDFNRFWKEAVTSAVAAELLSARVNQKNDDTFVASLLQNIGYLVMYLVYPAEFLPLHDLRYAPLPSQLETERALCGADHQELGAAMLRTWGIPESIHIPIAFHHHPENCSEAYRQRTELLGIADKITSVYFGFRSPQAVQEIQQILKEKYGISEPEVTLLIDQVAEETRDILAGFEIDPEAIKPYSQMLQEANRELCNLGFSYERVVVELRQAKAENEKLISELMQANHMLRSLAFRDSLTGVFNYRYFHEALEAEIQRCQRYGHILSLVIFDVDNFKFINDTYGHLAGDLILKTIGQKVACMVRTADTLARIGGDEFGLILPETNEQGLQLFAERVRRKVERLTIRASGKAIRVTVSVGGTTFEPETETPAREAMVEAADKALYYAKELGKNRFSFFALDGPG